MSSSSSSSPVSPRKKKSDEEDDDIGVQLKPVERKESATVAQLRRLASRGRALASTTESPHKRDSVPTLDSHGLASALLPHTKSLHADIRNFVEKEFVKSSASKELVRHLLFVIILVAGVTLHRSSYESYLMNQALITAFVTQQVDFSLQPFSKTFLDIGQPNEFADWLTNIVGGTLDADTLYSGRNMTPTERDYVAFNNRLLGGVRIRQLRAAPNKDCKSPYQLKSMTGGICYNYAYSGSNRDTTPFGPPEDPQRYKYLSSEECGSVSIWGNYLDYLEGGGYLVDVNLDVRDNSSFTEKFQQLIDDTWIENSTRAIIITMNFLNLELESRVAVMYLVLEIPGNGVLFPTVMIKTFRLNLYVVPLDYFRLFLEVLFALFVLYSIYSEGYEMWVNHKAGKAGGKGLRKYFYNGWNLIELLDISLYVTVVILYAQYIGAPGRYKISLDARQYFPDMEQIAASALTFYNILAVNLILTTFRTFKYLRLNHRLYLLWKTLRHAGADLAGFLFIFLIFIFGFIFMGWLTFGSDLDGFNTFTHSFATCWNFIIGNAPDYNDMVRSNRLLGPLFFTLFTIFIFFILTNMFIAILSNSFERVSPDNDGNEKLKDMVEEKIEMVVKGAKRLYLQLTKQEHKKRSIVVLLDELAQPQILENPDLTEEDVAKAIGPQATQAEIQDLFQWIKKLEAKKHKKAARKSSPDSTVDIEDSVRNTPYGTLGRTATLPSGGASEENELAEMRSTLHNVQTQLTEMKQLLERIASK